MVGGSRDKCKSGQNETQKAKEVALGSGRWKHAGIRRSKRKETMELRPIRSLRIRCKGSGCIGFSRRACMPSILMTPTVPERMDGRTNQTSCDAACVLFLLGNTF